MLLPVLALAAAAQADDLRVGTLHLDWPAGCSGKTETRTISLECPNGEHVIITPLLADPALSPVDNAINFTLRADGMSQRVMVPLAVKNGELRRQLVIWRANNTTVYSVASKMRRLFKEYYLLQYAVAGAGGLMFFTVEGYGDTDEHIARYDRLFNTAQFEPSTQSLSLPDIVAIVPDEPAR